MFVMTCVIGLLMKNGQAALRIDFHLYWALYSLVNLYIYFMAFLYTPVLVHVRGPRDQKEEDKERQKIMNDFY